MGVGFRRAARTNIPYFLALWRNPFQYLSPIGLVAVATFLHLLRSLRDTGPLSILKYKII